MFSYYLAGNYFNGGARHKPAFDKALDRYVSKTTGDRPALLDLVRYEYTDWRAVQHLHAASPFLDRGAVSCPSNSLPSEKNYTFIIYLQDFMTFWIHFNVKYS